VNSFANSKHFAMSRSLDMIADVEDRAGMTDRSFTVLTAINEDQCLTAFISVISDI